MNSQSPFQPAYGPLEKSDATWHFEQLIKDLLHHNTHQVSYNPNGEMTIIANHHFYNLTQILLHEPDFELVQLDQKDIAAYHELIKKIQSPSRKEALLIDESTKANIFPEMSNGEASAIRYYTDDCGFFKLINHLYHHHAVKPFNTDQCPDLPEDLFKEIADEAQVQLNTNDFLNVIIKEVLVHSAIAFFGLSKNYFKHIRLYFAPSTFDFESHQNLINGPGLILKRLENQYEVRIFAYGKFLKKTARVPLKEIVNQASEPESFRKKNPASNKTSFRLFGESRADDAPISPNGMPYYFSFNEKEQLFNVIEEFNKKDLIEFDPDHPLRDKLCFFLRQQPEIQNLFYETVIRVEIVNDSVLDNIKEIKREIARKGWGIYRTEGFQGGFGDSENHLDVYGKHGWESDCDLFKKIEIPISYVKNIESISSVGIEAERLMIPGTQILFNSYKHPITDDESNVYELDGKIIRSIDHTHPSSYSRAHVALRETLAFELPCIIQEMIHIDHIDKEPLKVLKQLLVRNKTHVLTIFSEHNIRQQDKSVIELLHHIELLPSVLKEMMSDRLPEELVVYFNFQVNTSYILEQLIRYFPENFPEYVPGNQTDHHIEKLVKLANSNCYSDQCFFGGDALNRQFLLDADVANLLDQETIQGILFYKNKKDKRISIDREIESDLGDILQYGFKDKQVLEWVNPNYDSYDLTQFKKQQSDYEKNTKRIIRHIMNIEKNVIREEADQDSNILLLPHFYKNLYDRLVDIKTALADIIQDQDIGLDKLLLIAAGNTPQDLFSQCQRRLKQIGKNLGYEVTEDGNSTHFNTSDTLTQFVVKFLNRNDLIFDWKIMHFLYDRIHFISCLVADHNLSIGNSNYRFCDVIEEIIKQCDQLPINHYACQQFSLRIQQVENYLKQNKEFVLYYHAKKVSVINYSESITLKQTSVQRAWSSRQLQMIEDLDHAIQFSDASRVHDLIQAIKDNRFDINYIYENEFQHKTNVVDAAVMHSTVDILNMLIQAGAKIDHPSLPRTPLDSAIVMKYFEKVEALVNAGAKLQLSSILLAIKHSSPEINEYLLKKYQHFSQVVTWLENGEAHFVPQVIEVMNHYYEKIVSDLLGKIDAFIKSKSENLSDKSTVQHNLSVQEQANKVMTDESLTIIDKLQLIIACIHDKYILLTDQSKASSCRTDIAEAANLSSLLLPVRYYMSVVFDDTQLSRFSPAILGGGVMCDNDALKKYCITTPSSQFKLKRY